MGNQPFGVKGAKDMKFVFTDKKVTLPDSIHAYAEKKVGKVILIQILSVN